MYWSSIRAYGSIEPDTSQTSTSGRGRAPGWRQWRSKGSPSVRSDERSVRRRSGRAACGGTPRRALLIRLLGRLGAVRASRRIRLLAARRSLSE